MKIFRFVPIAAALALVVSCEKPQNQADRDAEVERKVQERLAAERQQAELAARTAELDAREKALATKETAGGEEDEDTSATSAATPRTTPRLVTTAKTSSSSSKAPQGYETFYRKLEPHGAWRETGDYGYVWQPRAAQRSREWRPYTDGRWSYTDAGWTWMSDEPFGWATYHYGRWTRLTGIGWCWVPGDEWAPAWVSWRKSDQHVGWAPLPPEARFERNKGIKKWADSYYDIDADEYVFIPNEYIGDEHLERHALPPERNVTIVQQTTNVTNITYSNTVVVNEGPDYDELRGRSRQPVPRYRLQREFDVDESEAPRPRVQGDTLALIAPFFAARATSRPRTEGALLQQTTVERNWAGGNRAEAEQARAKMRAEATAPSDAPSKRYEKPVIAEGATTTSAAAVATPGATAPIATATASTPRAVLDASPTATPRATIAATATVAPTASPTPTATRPLTTPTPTASAVAASPSATATPSPTATPTPRASATATPTPTATITPRPTATPSPTPTATPTPSPTATATPRATATPSPIATATPTAAATATPVSTPIPTATPRPTFTPAPTAAPTAAMSPTPADAETPEAEGSPNASGVRGIDPRREKARQRFEEMQRSRAAGGMGQTPSPTPAAIAPVRGVTPPPTLVTPSPAAAGNAPEDATSIPKPRRGATAPPTTSPAETSPGAEEAASSDDAVAPGKTRDAKQQQRLRERAARMLGASTTPSPSPQNTP
jgi:hypothetical protein